MNPEIQTFIDKIKPAAQAIERETGIPWLFGATQAAHESRYGLSKLTVDANNLFGITADPDSSWALAKKPVYSISTLEYDSAKKPYTIVRGFRKYDSWEESLRDWAGLIQRRYPKALAAAQAGEFDLFAAALQAGGYATDPHYATQLVAMNQSLQDVA